MSPHFLLLLALPVGEPGPAVVNSHGYTTINWVLASQQKQADLDFYEVWMEHSDNAKLEGSVAEFLDWEDVENVRVLYNAWHLPGLKKDLRVRHVEENLLKARFGDRVDGRNPGGTYILLLEYRRSTRRVLLAFSGGVFLVESSKGIGAVDVRAKD